MNKRVVSLFFFIIMGLAQHVFANNIAAFQKSFPHVGARLSDDQIEQLVIDWQAQSNPNQGHLFVIIQSIDAAAGRNDMGQMRKLGDENALLVNRVSILRDLVAGTAKKTVRFAEDVGFKEKTGRGRRREHREVTPKIRTEQEFEEWLKHAAKIAQDIEKYAGEELSEEELDERQKIAERVVGQHSAPSAQAVVHPKKQQMSEVDENAATYYEPFQTAAKAVDNQIVRLKKEGHKDNSSEVKSLQNQRNALRRLGMYFQYPNGRTTGWDENNQPVEREDMYTEAMKVLNLVEHIPAFKEAKSALVNLYALNKFDDAIRAFENAAKLSQLPEMAQAFTSAVEGVQYLREKKRKSRWG